MTEDIGLHQLIRVITRTEYVTKVLTPGARDSSRTLWWIDSRSRCRLRWMIDRW